MSSRRAPASTTVAFVAFLGIFGPPMVLLSACDGDDDSATVKADAGKKDAGKDAAVKKEAGPVVTYPVGGTLQGLAAGDSVMLHDNGGDPLVLTANGSFTFPTQVPDGWSYLVTVDAQPSNPAQRCLIIDQAGVVDGAPVTAPFVTCTTDTFYVGGTATNVLGSGLTLEDNAGDDIVVPATDAGSVAFTFPTALASGETYAVTVKAQPVSPAQTCSVASGSGSVAGGNVTSVAVSCVNGVATYPIDVVVAGLATGAEMSVVNGSSAPLTFVAPGMQVVPGAVPTGTPYDFTVSEQPAASFGQTCVVADGNGTVAATSPTVHVVCGTSSYVNVATGADTNAGTSAAPWKTLTHALASTTSGSVILVAGGTYNQTAGETFPLVVGIGQSLVANPGSGTPLVAGGGNYTITGGDRNGQMVNATMVLAPGASEIVIDGLAFLGAPDALVADHATAALLNLDAEDTGGEAQVLAVNGANLTVRGGTFVGQANGLFALDSTTAVYARASTFTGTGADVLLGVTSNVNGASLDLGTAGAPGTNKLAGSGTTSLKAATATTGAIRAAGNTWRASTQGASAGGTYGASLVSGSASGANYTLVSGSSVQF